MKPTTLREALKGMVEAFPVSELNIRKHFHKINAHAAAVKTLSEENEIDWRSRAIRLAASARELADLLNDAHDTHIWSEDDDHPEDGCGYCTPVKELDELLTEFNLIARD